MTISGGCIKRTRSVNWSDSPCAIPKYSNRLVSNLLEVSSCMTLSGTGKTLIAQMRRVHSFSNGPETLSKMAGESQSSLRKPFEDTEKRGTKKFRRNERAHFDREILDLWAAKCQGRGTRMCWSAFTKPLKEVDALQTYII